MKLTTQRILGLQTSCLRAFVVLLGFVLAPAIVSAQESKPVGEAGKPAEAPVAPATSASAEPVAVSKMPDLSGVWLVGKNGEQGVVVIGPPARAPAGFEFCTPHVGDVRVHRATWSQEAQRFQLQAVIEESDEGPVTLTMQLLADSRTMRVTLEFSEQAKEVMRKSGVSERALQERLKNSRNQEWRRLDVTGGAVALRAEPAPTTPTETNPAGGSEKADISGKWRGEDRWGEITLHLVRPTLGVQILFGSYANSSGRAGTIILASSEKTPERFQGEWFGGENLKGQMSLQLQPDAKTIRGSWAIEPSSKTKDGVPAFSDLEWARISSESEPTAPAKPVADSKMPDISGTWRVKVAFPVNRSVDAGEMEIRRIQNGGTDFLIDQPWVTNPTRIPVQWSPARQQFEGTWREDDGPQSKITMQFPADSKTMRVVISTKKQDGDTTASQREELSNQEWTRTSLSLSTKFPAKLIGLPATTASSENDNADGTNGIRAAGVPNGAKHADQAKMPDISGKWAFNPTRDLNGATVAPPQMYVVARSKQAGIDFELLGTRGPTAAPLQLKWEPGTRRFRKIPLNDTVKEEATFELSTDGNQLSVRFLMVGVDAKKGGFGGAGVIERYLTQEWRRDGADKVAVPTPLKEPASTPQPDKDSTAKIPDIVGTWSRAESGTFSKFTIWPVENREFLFFVEGADGNGLLEWKSGFSNFQGFFNFNLLGDWTVQVSLLMGPKETRRLIISPFEAQRKQLLRSGFAKTERELDQKLSSDLTRVENKLSRDWARIEAAAQPMLMATVAVVKTEFEPLRIRELLRAKYREQPFRFFSNDTFRSVIVLAPAEAQEDIEVLIHKLDVREESNDQAASSNIAQQLPANQPQATSHRPDEVMPDISGRWRYTKHSEPGEMLDGELRIRRTEGEQSVLTAQRVPAFEPPLPAFLLKWRPDLRKFEIVPADPQAAKAAQELQLETFQVSADRQSIRQAVTLTEKGLEHNRKLTDQQIADYYNLDGIVLTRLGAIELEPNSTKPIAKVAEIQSGRSMFGVGVALPDTPAAKQLVEQLQAQESAAAAEAATIRQLQANGQAEQNQQPMAEHQRKLKNLLSTAFDLKLQLEELQVKELQSRLSRLERQIGQRKELREKIITRRAGELIEGDALRWDSTAPASTKLPGSAVGNTKQAATPEVVAILRERLALLWDDLRNGNAKPEAGLRAINELAQAEPPEAHAQHLERLQALLDVARGNNAVSKAEVLEIEAAYEAARSADDKRVQAKPGVVSSSSTTARTPKAGQIVIDLYGGSKVLPGLSENPNYSKLLQSLNDLKEVTTNFREIQVGDATTIVMAIVHDPSQRCQREARQTQKESELRVAINSALKAAGIEATRWDENSDAEEKAAAEPATSKTSRGVGSNSDSGLSGTLSAPTSAAGTGMPPRAETPKELEFLSQYPRFSSLSLDMTEAQFRAFLEEQKLAPQLSIPQDGQLNYSVPLGDGHRLTVMFGLDGKCRGIERITGKTSSTPLAEPAAVTRDKPATKTFHLEFAKAENLAKTVQSLLGDETSSPRMSVDLATNSLIVIAHQDDMRVIEAIVIRLDMASASGTKTTPKQDEPAGANKTAAQAQASATELEGLWEVVPAIGDAEKVADEKRVWLVFHGDLHATFQGRKLLAFWRMKLDRTQSPKRITLEGDRPARGLYEINGNELRLSLAPTNAEFPTKFGTERPEFKRISAKPPQDLIDDMRDHDFNRRAGSKLSEPVSVDPSREVLPDSSQPEGR